MKRNEWLKKEYAKLAEVVNAYQSEKVQLIIVDRLLPILEKGYKGEEEEILTDAVIVNNTGIVNTTEVKPKTVGATKALKEVLNTDFFYSHVL